MYMRMTPATREALEEPEVITYGLVGSLHGENMYQKAVDNPEDAISLMDWRSFKLEKAEPPRRSMFASFVIEDQVLYFYPCEDGVQIYKKIPSIEEDENWRWVTRHYHRRKAGDYVFITSFYLGFLLFEVTYYLETGIARIKATQDQRGYNRCVVAEGAVANATNQTIEEKVNEMVDEVKYRFAQLPHIEERYGVSKKSSNDLNGSGL